MADFQREEVGFFIVSYRKVCKTLEIGLVSGAGFGKSRGHI